MPFDPGPWFAPDTATLNHSASLPRRLESFAVLRKNFDDPAAADAAILLLDAYGDPAGSIPEPADPRAFGWVLILAFLTGFDYIPFPPDSLRLFDTTSPRHPIWRPVLPPAPLVWGAHMSRRDSDRAECILRSMSFGPDTYRELFPAQFESAPYGDPAVADPAPVLPESSADIAAPLPAVLTGPAATDTQGKGRAADAPPKPEPEFVFTRDGDGYFVRAFGAEGHFPALAGFRVLDKLLRSPGKHVSMFDLIAGDGSDAGLRTGRGSVQPALDPEAIADLKANADRLELEVKQAENDADREDSQRALDTVLERLMKDAGIGGKARDLNDVTNKLRPKIAGRIKTALEKLRASNPSLSALADHLENPSIRANGANFIYDPPSSDPAPNWDFLPVRRK